MLGEAGNGLLAYIPRSAPPLTGDYLDAVGAQGIYRWSAQRMPLKVYIQDGSGIPGYRPSFRSFLVKSFDEWARISNGRVSWRQVSSPHQADVVCVFTANARSAGHQGFEAGVTQTIIQENRRTGEASIQKAHMTILTQWQGRTFSDDDVYKTCLHEVGHAIGLQGHSNVPSDIMYYAVNPRQTPYLTQRDANTIAKLYSTYGQEPPIAYAPRLSAQFPQQPRFGSQHQSPQRVYPGSGYLQDRGYFLDDGYRENHGYFQDGGYHQDDRYHENHGYFQDGGYHQNDGYERSDGYFQDWNDGYFSRGNYPRHRYRFRDAHRRAAMQDIARQMMRERGFGMR